MGVIDYNVKLTGVLRTRVSPGNLAGYASLFNNGVTWQKHSYRVRLVPGDGHVRS